MAATATNLLVLGVGGNVSAGMVKALLESPNQYRIIGGCINPNGIGLLTCDHAVVTPLADDPNFLEWLVETCNRFKIDGVLSGVEPVLNRLTEIEPELEARTGARVIVAPQSQLSISGDKLQTAHWLKANGLCYTDSVDASDQDAVAELKRTHGYPLFAKPRHGKSSQGAMRINSDSELAAAVKQPNYVIQEHLGNDDAEYTAAVLGDRNGRAQGCIVMRRRLYEGTTVIAEIVDEPVVRDQVLAIAKAFKPVGPCNIQLRKDGDRAVCFEINLRYSGSAPMRAHFGFNDVDAGVRHFILGEELVDLPHVTKGIAVRYWNEAYLDPQVFHAFVRKGEAAIPINMVDSIAPFGRQS